jgi:hypothetical protein
MSRRDLLKLISLGLLPFESFAGILDAFKKTKPVDLISIHRKISFTLLILKVFQILLKI